MGKVFMGLVSIGNIVLLLGYVTFCAVTTLFLSDTYKTVVNLEQVQKTLDFSQITQ